MATTDVYIPSGAGGGATSQNAWADTYITLGRSILGSAAEVDLYVKPGNVPADFATGVASGAAAGPMATPTLEGGVYEISTGASATLGGVRFNSQTLYTANARTQKWFIAGRLWIPVAPSTETKSGIYMRTGTPNHAGIAAHYSNSSTNFSCGVFDSGFAVTSAALSTVTYATVGTAAFFNVYCYCDGTNIKGSVNGETAFTGAAATSMEAAAAGLSVNSYHVNAAASDVLRWNNLLLMTLRA